jgi:anti-sigma factor RsiW
MRNHEELPCQDLVELVNDYLEGLLDPSTRDRFRRHLDECPSCARYVDQMALTISLAGRLDPAALSPSAQQAVLEAFRGWSENERC